MIGSARDQPSDDFRRGGVAQNVHHDAGSDSGARGARRLVELEPGAKLADALAPDRVRVIDIALRVAKTDTLSGLLTRLNRRATPEGPKSPEFVLRRPAISFFRG